MEKMEALEQLQSHIEGWEVSPGQEGPLLGEEPRGWAAAGAGFSLGTRASPRRVLFGLYDACKKDCSMIFQLSPHKNLYLEFLLKNQ